MSWPGVGRRAEAALRRLWSCCVAGSWQRKALRSAGLGVLGATAMAGV